MTRRLFHFLGVLIGFATIAGSVESARANSPTQRVLLANDSVAEILGSDGDYRLQLRLGSGVVVSMSNQLVSREVECARRICKGDIVRLENGMHALVNGIFSNERVLLNNNTGQEFVLGADRLVLVSRRKQPNCKSLFK